MAREQYRAMISAAEVQTLQELFRGWTLDWGAECCYLRFLVAVYHSCIREYVAWFFAVPEDQPGTPHMHVYYLHAGALEFIIERTVWGILNNCEEAGYELVKLGALPDDAVDDSARCFRKAEWTRITGERIDPELSRCIDESDADV
jgi:hypothetical protein